MAAPRLFTPRTALGPLDANDVASTYALWIDAGVRKYLWDDIVIGRERAAEVITASMSHFQSHGYGLWAVCEPATADLMGVCGFRPSESDEPELLFAFWPRYWRQGIANESARAVIAYAFDVLNAPSIVAATDVANEASIRALHRLGMTLERRGTLNGLDTFFFRLTREQFDRASPAGH